MSHDSYLSGYIVLDDDLQKALGAIGNLPETSDEDQWPALTRAMFSYTPSPRYRDDVIHFAASYKDILDGWVDWENKFESLLAAFEYSDVRIIIQDCYRGDCIVSWSYESIPIAEGGGMRSVKRTGFIDYEDSTEADFE